MLKILPRGTFLALKTGGIGMVIDGLKIDEGEITYIGSPICGPRNTVVFSPNQIKKIIRLPLKKKILSRLTIGSDPELALVDPATQERIDACELISRADDLFGLDGNSATAELRPRQSCDPLIHYQNIRRILSVFRNIHQAAYATEFYATTHESGPLGGHIHIGHPILREGISDELITKMVIDQPSLLNLIDIPGEYLTYPLSSYLPAMPQFQSLREKVVKTVLNKRDMLITALDTLLSLPLMFVEVPRDGKLRKQSYGSLSYFRPTPWGIEYRTPPSWLATPKLTKAVLCQAYAIANAVLDNPGDYHLALPTVADFTNHFKDHDIDNLHPYLTQVIKATKTLPLYKKYKSNIDYLLSAASLKRPLLLSEIKTAWHIPFTSVTTSPRLTSSQMLEKVIKKIAGGEKTSRTTRNFIIGNPTDTGLKEILSRTNDALSSTVNSQNSKWCYRRVYLYGLSEMDQIKITASSSNITPKRLKHLQDIIVSLLATYNYPSSVKIDTKIVPAPSWHFRNDDLQQASPLQIKLKLGLNLPVRQYPNYLAETIILTALVFINPGLYKSWGYSKRTYRHTSLPILTRSIINTIKDGLFGKENLCAA